MIHEPLHNQCAQLARCRQGGQIAARTPERQTTCKARGMQHNQAAAKRQAPALNTQEAPSPSRACGRGAKAGERNQRTIAAARVRPNVLSICARGHRSCASLQPRTPRQWPQRPQPYWSAVAPPATKPSNLLKRARPRLAQAQPACNAYAVAPGPRSASQSQGYHPISARAAPRQAVRAGARPPSGHPRPQQPASQSPPGGPWMPRPLS